MSTQPKPQHTATNTLTFWAEYLREGGSAPISNDLDHYAAELTTLRAEIVRLKAQLIEANRSHGKTLLLCEADLTRLKAQRDGLSEALKLCISDDLRQSKHERNILSSRIEQARAALAAVEKDQG